MKNIILKLSLFLLTCVVALSCSTSQPSPWRSWIREKEKIRVLTTTVMIHDVVASIGGDRVACLPLIQGDLDPHSYQLVKGDDEKLSCADFIFYNGLSLEHGASLSYALKNHPHALAVGDVVLAHYPEKVLWIEGAIDPHIWMDISLWALIIDPIVDVLSKKDPAFADLFQENANKLRRQMQQVDEEILKKVQKLPSDKRYLVTSHDAFNYFAKRYLIAPDEVDSEKWQERFEAPEGLAPEGQLSPLDLQRIITHLQKHAIRVIFPESNVSHASIEKIVQAGREKGLIVKISKEHLYGDAMKPNKERSATYLETMQHNADIICSQIGEDSYDLGSTAHRSL